MSWCCGEPGTSGRYVGDIVSPTEACGVRSLCAPVGLGSSCPILDTRKDPDRGRPLRSPSRPVTVETDGVLWSFGRAAV